MESGYIEDFQLTATSEDELFPKNNGRPGNTGWCYMDQDMNPYFQVKLTHINIDYLLLSIGSLSF